MKRSDILTRIGVFYDGNFFLGTSNYYCFEHPRRSRLSIAGLHQFICEKITELEGTRKAQIVDAQFFRGRLSAREAEDRQKLYADRVLDEILMHESVTTHYLPIQLNHNTGLAREKGMDVLLALEAYESVILKHYDVVALFVCDGDYVPLIKKINATGARVMLLGCDFEYTDSQGRPRQTYTSQKLIQTATYPIMINEIIDPEGDEDSRWQNVLFVSSKQHGEPEDPESAKPVNGQRKTKKSRTASKEEIASEESDEIREGVIEKLKEGYGFILEAYGAEYFFHRSDLIESDFLDLYEGQEVEFILGENHQGVCATQVKPTVNQPSDRS